MGVVDEAWVEWWVGKTRRVRRQGVRRGMWCMCVCYLHPGLKQ